jgi:hypothetical protein
MQQPRCVAEQVAAPEQIGAVVHVPPVGGAAPGADDAGLAELGEVVRDEVLRLAGECDQLADPAIAPTELDHQLPPQRIAQEGEDLGRLDFDCRHSPQSTSSRFDASSAFDALRTA